MKTTVFPIDRLLTDVAFTLMALFAGMLAIALQVMRVEQADASEAQQTPMGDILVEARWADGTDVDVDLWTRAPEDEQAVGYSRRADRQTGYVRDDTGMGADVGGLNYETAVIRGLSSGRYVVNVHLYNSRGGTLPIRVQVAARLQPAPGRPGRPIAVREVLLTHDGWEETAFSFQVVNGAIVPGSISDAYIPLRDPAGGRR